MELGDKEHQEWIQSLKPEDIVCYDVRSHNTPYGVLRYQITKIERRTPTGKIVTKDGRKWDKYGRHRQSEWTTYTLQPYTEEIREEIRIAKRKNAILNKIQDTIFNNMPLEKLEEIYKLL